MKTFPDLPAKMRSLPVDKRGYPIPRFVAYVDGEPQFPIASEAWLIKATNENRCYVCGEKLGRYRASVIGPMCAINRTIGEPPCHTDCARFAAIHCPFLANPLARRVPDAKLKEKAPDGRHAPEAITRNPGAVCLWIATARPKPQRTPTGTIIFRLTDPDQVEWYAEGRTATRAEIMASIDSGLPFLRIECEREASEARRAAAHTLLDKMIEQTMRLLPAA